MHTSSGRWLYGLLLSLLTALLWGILPIKLKTVLQVMDPVTVTWYRLLVAGLLLLAWLAARRQLPAFSRLGRNGRWLVVLAIAGLTSNYVLYLVGLNMLSPGTTQLVIQVAPILLLLGSLWVFKESFSLLQGLGLLVLLLGFALFFNQRLDDLFGGLGQYSLGVLTVLLAALLWAFYGLAQKQLLTRWNSVQIMMVIYLACAALLTPGASLAGVAAQPAAGLAVAGLLPEYPGGLWRFCRSTGALGGVTGQRRAGGDAIGDLRCGGRCRCAVAGASGGRRCQPVGLPGRLAGGAGVGGYRTGTEPGA